MQSYRRLGLVVLAALAVAPWLAAEELNIRTMDMDRIFDQYYKTYKAKAELKEQQDQFENFVNDHRKEVTALGEKLKEVEAKQSSVVLSQEARDEAQKEAKRMKAMLEDKVRSFRDYGQRRENEIRKEFDDRRSALLNEIMAVVVELAKQNGIDLVLDSSGTTSNHIPVLVYYKPGLDLTKDVLAVLNRGHESEIPKEGAAPKAGEPTKQPEKGAAEPAKGAAEPAKGAAEPAKDASKAPAK